MGELPGVVAGSALPSTPKPRGGFLQDLLQQFGCQSSATSVTKARREAGFPRVLPQQPPLVPALSPSQPSPNKPGLPALSPLPASTPDLSSPSIPQLSSTSKTPIPDTSKEEIKMERKKRPRPDEVAPTTRGQKANVIVQSDTVADEPPTSRQKLFPRRKPDTARNRLREEIAQNSKLKADKFLVAHKDKFLPLLPENNHVAKAVAKWQGKDIDTAEYEELFEQPQGVKAIMKHYQLVGLSFLVWLHRNGFSGILGDEMGLGKTLQTLSMFQYLEEQDRKDQVRSKELRPYLVVCPLSVLESWVKEAEKWVPDLKVLRFHGTASEREHLKKVASGMEDLYGNETEEALGRKASREAGEKVPKLPGGSSTSYKIIVTTYEIFQAEQTWLKHSFLWRYVVLDEGHRIKNSITQLSVALRSINSEHRLILTGTPLQNNLMEMWALLNWLYPNVFTSNTMKLFKDSFDLSRGQVNREAMANARSLLELIMLRRMKDSPGVNLGIPPKEEVFLYVPLTPMQRFWYMRLLTRVGDSMLNDLFADSRAQEEQALKQYEEDKLLIKKKDTEASRGVQDWEETTAIMEQAVQKERASVGTSKWQRLMNLILQLRKCCSHPYMLPGALPHPYHLGRHVVQASGKFILLEKLLIHSVLKQNKKVLIFSGFTGMLDCCEELLSLVGDHGQIFKYLRLDGDTARARRNLDMRLFEDFNSPYKVMLLSTRAGGLGINLTRAEDVIFLDEDWNPQVTIQAEARAHRIGQTKKVTIYKLCTQGTVEEQMMGRIRKKLYLSAKITESMRNIHGTNTRADGDGFTDATDDMPQMTASQLKTLVRRGAQTLSRPEINVTEMLSWDFKTMMEICRDKPADPSIQLEGESELDEDQWLSMIERVACDILDGKKVRKESVDSEAAFGLPAGVKREDRRVGKNTTVMVGEYVISKESMNCGDWEAVPTLAGKDPRLAEPVREKRRQIAHESHCLACFNGLDSSHSVYCKSCPRAFHFDCLEPEEQSKVHGFTGFYCSQHHCAICSKKTRDVGGLLYRCRWCPMAFCEDCVENEELITDELPEFEMLGEGLFVDAFYVKCPFCLDAEDDNEDRKKWVEATELAYEEQHRQWKQEAPTQSPSIKSSPRT
ncbi:hypothetical protein BS50DRAFT_578116 [Corynespora cassiicola Philippines]|uniref:ISWI chromatin-remodeling complex ATPase ISW2 n=1 Tax=Corynespora cassiicola Philippines TaxID=1448308 RepID=A0A2T2NB81_CORCC|nr:hypothetical protein BS50DRAFT_578116 [Corynespora cassiicola Philippines]